MVQFSSGRMALIGCFTPPVRLSVSNKYCNTKFTAQLSAADSELTASQLRRRYLVGKYDNSSIVISV